MGFEPMCREPDKLISSQSRYDHFDTSPSHKMLLFRRMISKTTSISIHKNSPIRKYQDMKTLKAYIEVITMAIELKLC